MRDEGLSPRNCCICKDGGSTQKRGKDVEHRPLPAAAPHLPARADVGAVSAGLQPKLRQK